MLHLRFKVKEVLEEPTGYIRGVRGARGARGVACAIGFASSVDGDMSRDTGSIV